MKNFDGSNQLQTVLLSFQHHEKTSPRGDSNSWPVAYEATAIPV